MRGIPSQKWGHPRHKPWNMFFFQSSTEGRPRRHPKLHWWPLRNGQRSARKPWNDSTLHQHNGLLHGRGPWCLGVILTWPGLVICLTGMHSSDLKEVQDGTVTSIVLLPVAFSTLYLLCIRPYRTAYNYNLQNLQIINFKNVLWIDLFGLLVICTYNFFCLSCIYKS